MKKAALLSLAIFALTACNTPKSNTTENAKEQKTTKPISIGGENGDIVLKCSELVLKQYPNFSNALLMSIEAKRRQIETFRRKKNADFPNDISKYLETINLFKEIESQIINVHTLVV